MNKRTKYNKIEHQKEQNRMSLTEQFELNIIEKLKKN